MSVTVSNHAVCSNTQRRACLRHVVVGNRFRNHDGRINIFLSIVADCHGLLVVVAVALAVGVMTNGNNSLNARAFHKTALLACIHWYKVSVVEEFEICYCKAIVSPFYS